MTNPAIVEVLVQGKQGAPGMAWRGAWSGAANYLTRDAVTYGGKLWIALAASTNVAPGTDALKWEVMLEGAGILRDIVIDDEEPLTDALPAALKVNIDAAGGGDTTTGGVGEFFRMSLNGAVVARLRKTGSLALAGMLAIGAVDGAGAGPALKGNGAVLEARLDNDSGLTSMRTKGYEAQLGTLTSQAAGLDISATWNHASIAGPLIKANVVDTLSDAQALLIDLQKAGVSQARIDKNGNATLAGQLTTSGTIYTTGGNIWGGSNSSIIYLGSGADVEISRDAANVLALKRATNAQGLRVYNTFTDVSNYERLNIAWSGNVATISTSAAGTGTARTLNFQSAVGSTFSMATNVIITPASGGTIHLRAGDGVTRWIMDGESWVPNGDNARDLGTTSARLKSGYFGTAIHIGATARVSVTGLTGVNLFSSGAAAALSVQDHNSSSASSGGTLYLGIDDGAALASGDRIGVLAFRGTSLANTGRTTAHIQAVTSQAWVDGSAYGTQLEFLTTTNGATSPTTKLALGNDGLLSFGAFAAGTPTISKWTATTDYVAAVLFDGSNFASFVASDYRATTAYNLAAAATLRWASGAINVASPTYDLSLFRDAANTLAQRNGTNPQLFMIYNTYTDVSNNERGAFAWSGNFLNISTINVGTGSARGIKINTANMERWQFTSSGHFIAATDNIYDIGSAANAPRNVWAAGQMIAAGGVYPGGTTRLVMKSSADGILSLLNAAETGFGSLLLGPSGTTYNRLKHGGAGILDVRLANDSDYSFIRGKHRAHANAVAETPSATHTIRHFDHDGTEYKLLAVAA